MIWRWTPDNVAVFNKAGIVANRGVAVCDGKVFVLTIDMTIAMLNQDTGELIKRVPISQRGAGRGDALRLLRDERADLREAPRSSSAPQAPSTACAAS